MKLIETPEGKPITVDDDYYLKVVKWSWRVNKAGYAVRYTTKNYKNIHVYMHRDIMAPKSKNEYVDHINGNPLDNRRANLRVCTPMQNQGNRKAQLSKSRFKGVSAASWTNRWRAAFQMNGKKINLGTFNTEEEAALAYNEAALAKWGEFAKLNIVE